MSPYWGVTFFEFFPLFFHRLVALISGGLPISELAPDEIQVFVLALISVGAALVGTLLVLKKMTMLANSLSHTILLGIVIAYMIFSQMAGQNLIMNFKVLFLATLISGILTTLLTQLLHQWMKLQKDASIGLIFTSLFALGILFVTLYTRNSHIGLEVVTGSADALHLSDLKMALAICVINVVLVAVFFKEWRLICFDPLLARSIGFRPTFFSSLLMVMTSATAISAFRAVGVLLFLTFIVGLPLTARLITHKLEKILWISAALGSSCSLIGVALSRHMLTAYQIPLSTAGLVSTLIGVVFLVTTLTFSKKRGIIRPR